MKLVVVFLLAAIPVCCYASGSGCNAMDNVIAKTINGSVTTDEYLEVISKYVALPYNKAAVIQFKQCFNDQSEETLDNVTVVVDAIYNSEDCPQTS
ncbi:hypothetical protein D0T85_22140 [Bacteroides sp. 519]|nr:hypothetical protein [Bacteroides sp. 519]